MKLKLDYERKFIAQGKAFIAGVDEAGRGPLAGPVVAACAVMPLREEQLIDGVDDSKLLSESKREELFEIIRERAIEYTISVIDNREIDKINILNATKRCMNRCLEKLKARSDIVLVDAVKLENPPFDTLPIIHGDALSYSIAAASILAKVFRDRLMRIRQPISRVRLCKTQGIRNESAYRGAQKIRRVSAAQKNLYPQFRENR